MIECTHYKSFFQKRKDWNQPTLQNSFFGPDFSLKTLALPQEVLAKHFFWEGGRRRKSRGRNLKISTFWLSQVLVCLEAQYDAINEQQSSTFSASFPFSRQMCWQHGTFFKGTQFYGSWCLSKARVATSFWLPHVLSSKITVFHAKYPETISEMKPISMQGSANASFNPHPFQMSTHAKISFACLGKHPSRQMYHLTCKLSFFSHAAHVLLCLAFILFLLDISSYATSSQFSPSALLPRTRYTTPPSPHLYPNSRNKPTQNSTYLGA